MKLAIIVRKDLDMSTGKVAVQVGHASVLGYRKAGTEARQRDWYEEGQKKIVLKVPSLKELNELVDIAKRKDLNVNKVIDFGLTQIEPNTLTCIAIGPDKDEKIDEVVKHLKLY